jgi:hypothetical protein
MRRIVADQPHQHATTTTGTTTTGGGTTTGMTGTFRVGVSA